jgi:hypothetical protein
MTKFFMLLIIVALSLLLMPVMVIGAVKLLFTPLYAKEKANTFAISLFVSLLLISQQPAKIVDFKGTINKNKVLLQWMVKENENADQFVVEKSSDGKNFAMAALVFGTDKAETENYQFYEKANHKKNSYRIKLVTKKKETEYSAVIEIGPDSKTSEK